MAEQTGSDIAQEIICHAQERELEEAGILTRRPRKTCKEFLVNDDEMYSTIYLEKLDKLYRAYRSGDFESAYCPTFKTVSDALESSAIGDVFQIKGDKFISIKLSDNKAEQLKISKDTYFKLFDPAYDLRILQSWNGDCGFLSVVYAFYNDPYLKPAILRSFEELEGGIINVTLTLDDGSTFKNTYESTDIAPFVQEGVLNLEYDGGKFLSPEYNILYGARGFQMLEDANGYACIAQKVDILKRSIDRFKKEILVASPTEDRRKMIEKFISDYQKEIEFCITNPVEAAIKLREGVSVDKTASKFGLHSHFYDSKEYMINFLKDENNWDKFVFNTASINKEDQYLISSIGIVGNHWYQIIPFKNEKCETMFEVINPHDTKYKVVIDSSQFLELFNKLYATPRKCS